MKNCRDSGNAEWYHKHEESLNELCDKYLPHGSGIDCGVKLDLNKSTEKRVIFTLEFHHMGDGYYDGWTQHTLIVTPNFCGFDIRITGRNRDDIKDYLYDLFRGVLSTEVI